jgi:hypothetical protein
VGNFYIHQDTTRRTSLTTVDQLNRPNLDDAMAVKWVKAGHLGIDDDRAGS